jgi:hypothetical protein
MTMDIQTIGDRLVREKSVAETALPAMMLSLAAEEVLKAGYEFRADIQRRLGVAVVAPLSVLDSTSVPRASKRLAEISGEMLRELNADDPQHMLYSCCMFCLLLVAEDHLADKNNMAVLVSMLLLNELKHEGADSGYQHNEQRLEGEAKKLLGVAQRKGLYNLHQQLIAPEMGLHG